MREKSPNKCDSTELALTPRRARAVVKGGHGSFHEIPYRRRNLVWIGKITAFSTDFVILEA